MCPMPISVVLPVRDGAMAVASALTDLLSGMELDDELLAVNDGSTDATPEILTEWASRDAKGICRAPPQTRKFRKSDASSARNAPVGSASPKKEEGSATFQHLLKI